MFPFATEVFAMAQGGGGGESGSAFMQFIPLILIFAIFWFLVIRPQQKKSKIHRELVANLKKGDQVVTDSGIFGSIQKVAEDSISVEISPKVIIRVQRARVSEVVGGGGGAAAPAKEEKTTKATKAKKK